MSDDHSRRAAARDLRSPAVELRTELYALCDLLLTTPLPRGVVLQERTRHVIDLCAGVDGSGMVRHILGDLHRDLSEGSGVNPGVHVSKLTLAAERFHA